jgi:hypothetical protein
VSIHVSIHHRTRPAPAGTPCDLLHPRLDSANKTAGAAKHFWTIASSSSRSDLFAGYAGRLLTYADSDSEAGIQPAHESESLARPRAQSRSRRKHWPVLATGAGTRPAAESMHSLPRPGGLGLSRSDSDDASAQPVGSGGPVTVNSLLRLADSGGPGFAVPGIRVCHRCKGSSAFCQCLLAATSESRVTVCTDAGARRPPGATWTRTRGLLAQGPVRKRAINLNTFDIIPPWRLKRIVTVACQCSARSLQLQAVHWQTRNQHTESLA